MIFVTGGSGFIGRSLLRVLQAEEREVRVYDGRINAPLDLRAQLDGVETIVHLAGAESRGRVRLLEHVDVDGTQRLIEEAIRAEVKHLVTVSRLEADPYALHPLLQAKGRVERAVQESGIPYTILRSATLFGRGDRFLNLIAQLAIWSWPLVWLPGGGKVAMQPLWVEDLVRCLIQAIDQPQYQNKLIEVAGAETMKYRDVVRQVLAVTGWQRIPFRPPMQLVRGLAMVLFRWRRYPPVTRFFLDRLSTPEITDPDTIYHHFRFRPVRMIQQMAFLRRPDWWRTLTP